MLHAYTSVLIKQLRIEIKREGAATKSMFKYHNKFNTERRVSLLLNGIESTKPLKGLQTSKTRFYKLPTARFSQKNFKFFRGKSKVLKQVKPGFVCQKY